LSLDKNTIKRATQVNGHSFKLHFCMFERSQLKHNSLDCDNFFWNISHSLQNLHVQSLTQIKKNPCSKHSNFKSGQFCFFQMSFFYQICTIPSWNWRGFKHWWLKGKKLKLMKILFIIDFSIYGYRFWKCASNKSYLCLCDRGHECRNPSFELMTKIRVYKGASQEWSPGITLHAPENVGGCEEMNFHTPNWAPTLGVGVQMDFWIFKVRLQGSKLIRLKSSLYHWKAHGT